MLGCLRFCPDFTSKGRFDDGEAKSRDFQAALTENWGFWEIGGRAWW